jgi:putative transposase
MIVARTFSTTPDSVLVNNAVNMVAANRKCGGATILHSDHRTHFTLCSFGENVRRWGLLASWGTIGQCDDNAVMESFWARTLVGLLNAGQMATNCRTRRCLGPRRRQLRHP